MDVFERGGGGLKLFDVLRRVGHSRGIMTRLGGRPSFSKNHCSTMSVHFLSITNCHTMLSLSLQM
jgi:hypothetical protein